MAKYKRDPSFVLSTLKENQTGQIITTQACKVQIPVRFTEVGLGEIGINTFAYGLFPIILDSGQYAVMNMNALVQLDPYKLSAETIDDVDYHVFHFTANQILIKSSDIVRRDTLMYNVFDEFIFKGKIPWYVEYDDLGKLFDTAKKYGNSNVATNLEVIEFIAAMVARSKDDRTKHIRSVCNTYSDASLDKVSYVPLNSVYYSVNNTLNKIAGSYFSEGVTSALVNQSKEISKVEKLLRS